MAKLSVGSRSSNKLGGVTDFRATVSVPLPAVAMVDSVRLYFRRPSRIAVKEWKFRMAKSAWFMVRKDLALRLGLVGRLGV